MIYTDIQQVFFSTSSLTMASYFSQKDQSYLLSNVTLSNFPFGKSEKDVFQVSIFSFDGSQITSSYITPSGIGLPFTRSYYDVFNKYKEYSYSSYQSDVVITGKETKSVFLDVSDTLEGLGVVDGNYKVGIQLVRNVVGSHSDQSQRLLIQNISPSRTEISVIPVSLRSQISIVNDEFYSFSNGKAILRDVIDGLVVGISRPEIYKIFYSVAAENPNGADRFMFDYGFKRGTDVVNFLSDLYYGVKRGERRGDGQYSINDILGIFNQFSNWGYQNYNQSATFQEIRDQYYSLFRYIIDQELNRITNKRPDDYDVIVEFLSQIYYQSIFFPVVSRVESEYVNYISGYFKNYITFDDQRQIAILNTKIVPSLNGDRHDVLTLKLNVALPTDIVSGQTLWISNLFASRPIIQNLYFFSKSIVKLRTLQGPNLNLKFENEGNSTDSLSIENLIGETGSLYDELFSKLETKNNISTLRSVDYRSFENFINFSSAGLRVDIYSSKLENLYNLENSVVELESNLISSPDDEFYLSQLNTTKKDIDSIKASFDGYESFLYSNQSWYEKHTETYNGVSSASLYDTQNLGSLINNVPSFMVEDNSNDDYIKFVGMIGHYFDNLSVHINQFTEKNDASSSPNRGVSMDLVKDVLISLGWDTEISRENLPLLLGSFSKSDFSLDSPLYNKVGELSENDRNKLIWKRILNTLPFIYKTKGTKASINAIISCFGIPKNIIKIKEYGEISSVENTKNSPLYVFEDTKFEPRFSGSGEYFQLPWTGSIRSIEFDIRFDKSKISDEGQIFRLVNGDGNWVIGAYRDRGVEWGKMFLSVSDGSGSVATAMTQKVPLFDGTSYTVLLRTDDGTSRPTEYPMEYELLVKKSDREHIVFSASSSLILSGSYNQSFKSGSNVFFGNYQQSTSSFGVDPEAFFGNLDEIKLWEIVIDDKSLESHAMFRGGYNFTNPNTMTNGLVARVSFSQPIDLHSVTSSKSFPNLAFRGGYPNITAVNFPISEEKAPSECNLPTGVSTYPYQFSTNNIIQSVRVPSFGSQTMRSNKISHVEQTLVNQLSPGGRSSFNSTRDVQIGSNKVGVFFSPIDSQNEEILKFFGDYNFDDLIGDPALSYEPTYRQFEKFRQIYYDRGFGAVDYQTFMNLVKAYFDKAMFKYISTLVPARSKLISGMLLEPSILERPKLKLKPITQDKIEQSVGTINLKDDISAKSVGQLSANVSTNHVGSSILNDVNHRFYSDVPDQYSFGVYSNNGIYHSDGEYYRVDVIKSTKKYQAHRKLVLSGSQLNEHERQVNLDGTTQTVTCSFYNLNIIKLPEITEYYFTASWNGSVTSSGWYFSGSVSIPLDYAPGSVGVAVTVPHTISGMTGGSIRGVRYSDGSQTWGNFISPMRISAQFFYNTTPVYYAGFFDVISGSYTFEGLITMLTPATNDSALSSQFRSSVFSTNITGSIFREFAYRTSQTGNAGMFTNTNEISMRKNKSLLIVPENREMLFGYFPTHYKYKKQTFSQKEINSFENSYEQSGKSNTVPSKWKRGSQSKKTTVDDVTGNLNSTEPIERKSA